MPGFELRPVRAEDSEELFRIHRESMTEYLEQAFEGWSEERAWEHHLRCMTSGTAQVIIVGGHVAGSLEVVADDHKLWIVRIEIDPRFQRQGLGTAIVQQIQRRAEGQSMAVVLEVFAHNPARHLYERLGFRAVQPRRAIDPNGVGVRNRPRRGLILTPPPAHCLRAHRLAASFPQRGCA